MFYEIFPTDICNAIKLIPNKCLCEIRIRAMQPILVNILGENKYLTHNGYCELSKNDCMPIIAKPSDISYILEKCSNDSLYSINDQLINGYISLKGGVRIGIAGEVVSSVGVIKTVKNITSLNVRIPHEVPNCSMKAYLHLVNGSNIYNTLIVSPAGAGKTTFLRDFATQLSKREKNKNILVVDERCEITGISEGVGLDSCKSFDIYSNCKKSYAFENGIRSMKPDVIITDELNLSSDIDAIENALTMGVKVIASIHASSITDLKNKKSFSEILNKKLFDRFVILSSNHGPGTLEGIYDEDLHCIYC